MPLASFSARVVVAEDDGEMRRLVAEALRKDGHEVIEVPDGARLLVWVLAEIARASPALRDIHLVVTDVRMPGCSGVDVVKEIRDAGWDVPVVLMTAFGDDETRARAASLGARLFDKPFDVRALRAHVAALLSCRA
jgi:DNA-binding response OmpR family regulator